VTARLRSPHTITVHDFGRLDDGVLFLTMELLDGPTLDRVINSQGRLGAARVCDIARQVCLSLEEAHAAGLLHRDLKPSNIAVNQVGGGDFVKVLDFGLALDTEEASRLTQSGYVVGSVAYLSPEQAQGFNQQMGPAADIYALGATMFHLLSGRPPFQGSTTQVLLAQVALEPPRLSEVVAEAEVAPLEPIIERCLNKESGERFQSAAEMRAELEAQMTAAASAPLPAAPAPAQDDEPTEVGMADTLNIRPDPAVVVGPTETDPLGDTLDRVAVTAPPPAPDDSAVATAEVETGGAGTEERSRPRAMVAALAVAVIALAGAGLGWKVLGGGETVSPPEEGAAAAGAEVARPAGESASPVGTAPAGAASDEGAGEPEAADASGRTAAADTGGTEDMGAAIEPDTQDDPGPPTPPEPEPAKPAKPAAKPSKPKIAKPRIAQVETVNGALDAKTAKGVLRKASPALARCAAKTWSRTGKAAGLSFSLIVRPDGGVRTLRPKPGDSAAKAVASCAEGALKALRFPAFEGAAFEVVRWRLRPGSSTRR